jgi:hypothetical protein
MKWNQYGIGGWLAVMLVLPALVFPTSAQAEAESAVVAADAAVTVDVILNIDQETRAITLKDEDGVEWVLVAGPEVRNFDQLKRGDLVIMEYYSGLAIALEPKGSGLKARISEIEVERAKQGDKPGGKVTESTYAAAQVTAVDQDQRTVTLQGARGSIRLGVGDGVDLSSIEVGQEVEALYTQSFAVSVEPAPAVSGTVKMEIKAVALGIGVEWGGGTLTMYDGTTHDFKVGGLTLADVGVASVEAIGEVYQLVEAKDLAGTFLAGQAGGALVGGGSAIAMKNTNGVVMKLKSTQKGVRLTLAGEGLKIELK